MNYIADAYFNVCFVVCNKPIWFFIRRWICFKKNNESKPTKDLMRTKVYDMIKANVI